MGCSPGGYFDARFARFGWPEHASSRAAARRAIIFFTDAVSEHFDIEHLDIASASLAEFDTESSGRDKRSVIGASSASDHA